MVSRRGWRCSEDGEARGSLSRHHGRAGKAPIVLAEDCELGDGADRDLAPATSIGRVLARKGDEEVSRELGRDAGRERREAGRRMEW